ncbi:MAG: molybdopterin dinucleotide binding domain-containing protein, partial [Deferribacterota bacterium]|nr:molybdopterin dinucleotide binding domain-containing protein [Deferribacterota bacterium]
PDAAFLRGNTTDDYIYTRLDPRPIPLYNFEGYDMIKDGRTPYKLVMIAKAARNKSHSTYDNVPFIKDEFPGNIWLNTKDAEERGIKNDDVVYVYNDRGCVKVKAYVSDRMRPGSCNLEQGSWYSPSTTEFVTIKMDVHNAIEDPNHMEDIKVPVDVGGCSATLVPFLESGPHDPHQSVMGIGGSGMSHNSVLVEVSKTKPE